MKHLRCGELPARTRQHSLHKFYLLTAKLEIDCDECSTFNGVYSEDKNKFGNPASTKHQATDPKNVPDWIVAVNNHASKVLGGQVKKKKGKGLKRKRNE